VNDVNESGISFGDLVEKEVEPVRINPIPIDFESRYSVQVAVGECLTGIFLAGAVFGFALVVIPSIIFAIVYQAGDPFVIFMALFSALIGLIIGALTGSMALGAVTFFNWLFDGILTRRVGVVLTGGLAGYIPFSWVISTLVYENRPRWQGPTNWLDVVIFAGVPFVAMIFGHVGATWAAWKSNVWADPEELMLNRENKDNKNKPGIVQFEIKHLLKITLIFSLIFAVNQLSPNHEVLISVGFYIALQSLLLFFDYYYFRRLKRKTSSGEHVRIPAN